MTVAELLAAEPEVGWVVTDPSGQVVQWGPLTVAEAAAEVGELIDQLSEMEA